MSDKSSLEERLFKLMKEYKQPVVVPETRPRYGLVAGLSGLLGAGLIIIGAFIGSRFYKPPSAYLPSPTPIVEKIAMETSEPSPTAYIIPTPTFNPTSLPAPQVVMEGSFRQHYTAAIGSGPLMNVTYSDGMATFDEGWLATYHYRLQLIRPQENPDGCGVSIYNTDKIWFGCAMRTTVTVNDVPIADLYVPTGSHGYIFEWPLNIGDKICVTKFNRSGYHIYFGPDLYWHYDSYCYRGHCQGS